MTQEEKERIDYIVKKMQEEKEKNINEWGCAWVAALIVAVILSVIFKLVTQ